MSSLQPYSLPTGFVLPIWPEGPQHRRNEQGHLPVGRPQGSSLNLPRKQIFDLASKIQKPSTVDPKIGGPSLTACCPERCTSGSNEPAGMLLVFCFSSSWFCIALGLGFGCLTGDPPQMRLSEKFRVPYFGVLIRRILLFRVLYY